MFVNIILYIKQLILNKMAVFVLVVFLVYLMFFVYSLVQTTKNKSDVKLYKCILPQSNIEKLNYYKKIDGNKLESNGKIRLRCGKMTTLR